MENDDESSKIKHEIDGDSVIIDNAFKKEIGIDIYSAARYLVKNVITIEGVESIVSIGKDAIATEIERRNIPTEDRFLLLNAVLCTMFKTSAAFHRAYIKTAKHIMEDKEKQYRFIELIKER